MEKVKFRAWDPGLKKMFFDGFAIIPTSPDWSGIFIRGIKDDKLQRLINDYYKDIGDVLEGDYDLIDWTEYTQLELMQFTGLTDKNGVEIYSGDVIKRIDTGGTQLVIWRKDCWLARAVYDSWLKRNVIKEEKDCSLYFMTTYKIEVIGNIHQDKHLLD
jgi:uncharacterized phage protein (TIGR01671 family)